jgi:hypothetical protein
MHEFSTSLLPKGPGRAGAIYPEGRDRFGALTLNRGLGHVGVREFATFNVVGDLIIFDVPVIRADDID